MLSAAADPVRCVKGCGSGDTVAVIGIVVAFLSLAVALMAWRVAQKSLKIANAEHQVFLDRLNARADFGLTVGYETPEPVDGVIETDQDITPIRWSLGIENNGEKAADGALVNFLVPRPVANNFRWVTQNGEVIPDLDHRHGPLSTSEPLLDIDGRREPSLYLVKEIPRVSLKGHRVAWAEVDIYTTQVGQEVSIPVSFRVESDDLPDDVMDRRKNLEIVVRRVG